jgi:putative transposase
MGRKKYNRELKAQIALDAIKGQKTIAELASEYGVHANQISIMKILWQTCLKVLKRDGVSH